jgi:hypothetical protein
MSAAPNADYGEDDDVAEPQPGTIGVASGTAKCHHCGERIRSTVEGWEHIDTGAVLCEPAQNDRSAPS